MQDMVIFTLTDHNSVGWHASPKLIDWVRFPVGFTED